MDALLYEYVVTIELKNIKIEDKQSWEERRRNKVTPYVKVKNFMLTPDSQTPDATNQEVIYLERKPSPSPSGDVWVTPKRSHNEGVDFTKCRRINFDLAEDEEEKMAAD